MLLFSIYNLILLEICWILTIKLLRPKDSLFIVLRLTNV